MSETLWIWIETLTVLKGFQFSSYPFSLSNRWSWSMGSSGVTGTGQGCRVVSAANSVTKGLLVAGPWLVLKRAKVPAGVEFEVEFGARLQQAQALRFKGEKVPGLGPELSREELGMEDAPN